MYTIKTQFGMFHVGFYFVHTKGCKCDKDCPCTAPSPTITKCNCSTQTPLQTIENTSPTTTKESPYTTTTDASPSLSQNSSTQASSCPTLVTQVSSSLYYSVFDKKYYCAVHKNPKTRVKPLTTSLT